MAKKFTKFEKTIIMNTAKSCYVILDKKAKIEQKIKEKTASLQAELEAADSMLEALCGTVSKTTEGVAPYELVKREITTVTGEDGKEKKSTRFFFADEEAPVDTPEGEGTMSEGTESAEPEIPGESEGIGEEAQAEAEAEAAAEAQSPEFEDPFA